jgi:hypothetical protein
LLADNGGIALGAAEAPILNSPDSKRWLIAQQFVVIGVNPNTLP